MDTGIFTRAELISRGENDSSLRRLVREGWLTRLRDGWYASATAHPDAVEAVRRGGALSCASALSLRGFWVSPGYPGVHVRAPRGKHQPGFCRHRGRAGSLGYRLDRDFSGLRRELYER